jgi:hypothetical protein
MFSDLITGRGVSLRFECFSDLLIHIYHDDK